MNNIRRMIDLYQDAIKSGEIVIENGRHKRGQIKALARKHDISYDEFRKVVMFVRTIQG